MPADSHCVPLPSVTCFFFYHTQANTCKQNFWQWLVARIHCIVGLALSVCYVMSAWNTTDSCIRDWGGGDMEWPEGGAHPCHSNQVSFCLILHCLNERIIFVFILFWLYEPTVLLVLLLNCATLRNKCLFFILFLLEQ